jgi:VIT1/CCC1 family predicted Fe2+/Mn2+ transporter
VSALFGTLFLIAAVVAFVFIGFTQGGWETGEPPPKTAYWPAVVLLLASLISFLWRHIT